MQKKSAKKIKLSKVDTEHSVCDFSVINLTSEWNTVSGSKMSTQYICIYSIYIFSKNWDKKVFSKFDTIEVIGNDKSLFFRENENTLYLFSFNYTHAEMCQCCVLYSKV